MSAFGPGITQSVAGTEAAQRVAQREAARKARPAEPKKRVIEDELDLELTGTDGLGAVRRLKGNEEEEANLDHKGHPAPQQQQQPQRDRPAENAAAPTAASTSTPAAKPTSPAARPAAARAAPSAKPDRPSLDIQG
jgi:hypothetical protein